VPLAPGSRLGPYQIVTPIGAGGMGEVYRASDTNLNREVAIKVLPEAFAADADRLARFAREAQLLASLNHPNIAQIFGIEASSSSGQRALIMELVDGRDLSDLIATESRASTLDVLEWALPIARQVADALEAAHEQGIVHRDLKPANIKVRADGTVKVLDFGLAKALDAAGAASGVDPMNSPTLTTARATQFGVILGTAAYMAPEQARGKAVDKRADIWAFGCVLFEMLSGDRLFTGDDASDVLAAVLRQEIDWTAVPADAPAELKRLLARCLDRDPRTRLRDIGEARVLLSSPLSGMVPAATTAEAVTPITSGPSRRTSLTWAAAGLMVGAALVAAGLWFARGSSTDGASDVAPEFVFQRLTNLPGPERHPDISPDGRQALYSSRAAGNSDIYLLRVGGARAINLTASSPDDDEQGRFSPTGDQVVFRSSRDGGGLFLMGATGESVKRLTTAGYDPAWSPDGHHVVYSTEGVDDPYARSIFAELWTVDVAAGTTTRVYAGDAVQPAWSPDGSRIAYWANTGGQRDIWTIAAGGGEPLAVTSDGATDWSPIWSPDGQWLYFASDRGGSMNLWRVRIDQATGRTLASPQPVTNSVRAIGSARFSSSGTRIIAMGYDATSDITVFNFDPSAPSRMTPRATIRNQAFRQCEPSPDGVWLACTERGAHEDIVLVRSDGSETRRLMDDGFKDRGATWSPDGRTLAFYSTRAGKWETWAIDADGSNLRQLTNMDKDTGPMVWSPDGKRGIVSAISTRTVWRLDPSRMNSLPSVEMMKDVAEAGLFDVQSWAPSGTLIAGSFFPNPLTAIPAVFDLAARTLRKLDIPRDHAGVSTAFLPDSRRLLVSSTGALTLIDLSGGAPRQLRTGGAPGDTYLLSRDGRTLVLEHSTFDSDIWLMELSDAGR
jgi:eukaryotic-like serine/threonine-protein kinase